MLASETQDLLERAWHQVATDYHGALVHLTTMRAEKKQYLIFGYVELFPHDITLPRTFSAAEKPWAVPGSGGDITLVLSPKSMPTADTLAWCKEAAPA